MPQITKLVVVLPCHSLEDFPTHETGENADSLLASWTVVWHPDLINAANSIPIWVSQDYVTEDLSGALIVAPKSCEADLPTEVVEASEQNKAVLVSGKTERRQYLDDQLLAPLIAEHVPDGSTHASRTSSVNDFFALGYAFLQVQLMTRQLRYSTTLDLEEFERRVVVAAHTYQTGDREQTSKRIATCFDLLLQERNNYYPTEASLLNLVLVQEKPGRLVSQLQETHQQNVLMSGSTLRRLKTDYSQEFALLNEQLQSQQVDLVSSGQYELPIQLVSIESIVNQIGKGIGIARETIGQIPRTFGSYCFGLNPQLPNILKQFGYTLALHTVFSGGKTPVPSSPVINWQGSDGTNLEALSVVPIDANASDAFVKLGPTIGEMLDGYHHAELLFVHWPNRYCESMEDLKRIEKYGPLFGSFKTMSAFCDIIYDSGYSDNYAHEDYSFPYLEEACERKLANPISRWSRYWRMNYRLLSLYKLISICSIAAPNARNWTELAARADELQDRLEGETAGIPSHGESLDSELDHLLQRKFGVTEVFSSQVASLPTTSRLINPIELSRVVQLIRDNPAQMETTRIEPFEISNQPKNIVAANAPPLVVQSDDVSSPVLRNELFEVYLDPSTGGVRSVNRYQNKRNLFSQQLAGRISRRNRDHGFWRHSSRYTRMRVEELKVHSNPNAEQHLAKVSSVGFLEDEFREPSVEFERQASQPDNPHRFAEFEQTITVRRGDPRIYFDVAFSLNRPITGTPWRNHIASRIAWGGDDASIYRSENEMSDRVFQEKFSAPNFVEIRSTDWKLSVLPCGLPFHRRSSRRTLDTILMVQGEQQTRFQFAIAVDPSESIREAIDCCAPTYVAKQESLDVDVAGWLFHLNCRNVVITSLRPVFSSNRTTGVVMRVQETEGRPGELKITCPFKLSRAERCDFSGERQFELPIEGDVATCNFLEFQYFQIELGWHK